MTTSTASMADEKISATPTRAMGPAIRAEAPFRSPDATTIADAERYM